MPNLAKLILVFEEARSLVARPGNDFSWSGWHGVEDAQQELDQVLQELRSGTNPNLSLGVLFAPTGPLQELSLSSRWGDEFVELAARFDEAIAEETRADCPCLQAPSRRLETIRELGMDRRFGEPTLLRCPDCGRLWLRYLYEDESISRSGRWYLGVVTSEELVAENALPALESLDWYFYGGSAFYGQIGRTSGPIRL